MTNGSLMKVEILLTCNEQYLVLKTIFVFLRVAVLHSCKAPGSLRCCPSLGGGSVVVDFLFIVTPIVGVCNRSMFCCTLLYVHSSIAIILMGKGELVALLNLSSWCLVMVEWLFFAVP